VMKTIPIRCTGSEMISLDRLTPLQGTLKTLSPEAKKKLRTSIEKHGIRFPIFYWRHNGSMMTVDGHARVTVLREMLGEGFTIEGDLVPADRIEARDEREAKEMILISSSRYGRLDDRSFFEFTEEAGLDIDELMREVDLPEIMLGQFHDQYSFDDLEAENAQLSGVEDAVIQIVIPRKFIKQVTEWLADGEGSTARQLGRGVMKRCGLL